MGDVVVMIVMMMMMMEELADGSIRCECLKEKNA